MQNRYQVDLLLALAILVGTFVFHQARKRQQAKAAMLVAAAVESYGHDAVVGSETGFHVHE